MKIVKKKRSAADVPGYPIRKPINLAIHESHSKAFATIAVAAVAILLLALVVAKFGVINFFGQLNKAEMEYNKALSDKEAMRESASRYDEVLKLYRSCSLEWMNDNEKGGYVSVNRLEVLDLIENDLMTVGVVKSVRIINETLTVSMAGMNLKQIADMQATLLKNPIVSSVELVWAKTENEQLQNELDFSIIVILTPKAEVEG